MLICSSYFFVFSVHYAVLNVLLTLQLGINPIRCDIGVALKSRLIIADPEYSFHLMLFVLVLFFLFQSWISLLSRFIGSEYNSKRSR